MSLFLYETSLLDRQSTLIFFYTQSIYYVIMKSLFFIKRWTYEEETASTLHQKQKTTLPYDSYQSSIIVHVFVTKKFFI